jgi:hypothetical protein
MWPAHWHKSNASYWNISNFTVVECVIKYYICFWVTGIKSWNTLYTKYENYYIICTIQYFDKGLTCETSLICNTTNSVITKHEATFTKGTIIQALCNWTKTNKSRVRCMFAVSHMWFTMTVSVCKLLFVIVFPPENESRLLSTRCVTSCSVIMESVLIYTSDVSNCCLMFMYKCCRLQDVLLSLKRQINWSFPRTQAKYLCSGQDCEHNLPQNTHTQHSEQCHVCVSVVVISRDMKNNVCWKVTPCRVVNSERMFERKLCLHLQGRQVVIEDFSEWKILL